MGGVLVGDSANRSVAGAGLVPLGGAAERLGLLGAEVDIYPVCGVVVHTFEEGGSSRAGRDGGPLVTHYVANERETVANCSKLEGN